MPAVYLCNVIGDGVSTLTAFRPDLPVGARFACLMIDDANGKAMVVSPDNTLTGTGINNLLQSDTWANLRTLALTTNPTAGQRTAANTWLTNNGYQTLTGAQVTWVQCIHFIARQVNAAADLATVSVQ